jgi:hypothetical protein
MKVAVYNVHPNLYTGQILHKTTHTISYCTCDNSALKLKKPSGSLISISDILWWSVLFVEITGVPGENHWPAASHWQTLSHNVVSSTSRLSRIRTHNLRRVC